MKLPLAYASLSFAICLFLGCQAKVDYASKSPEELFDIAVAKRDAEDWDNCADITLAYLRSAEGTEDLKFLKRAAEFGNGVSLSVHVAAAKDKSLMDKSIVVAKSTVQLGDSVAKLDTSDPRDANLAAKIYGATSYSAYMVSHSLFLDAEGLIEGVDPEGAEVESAVAVAKKGLAHVKKSRELENAEPASLGTCEYNAALLLLTLGKASYFKEDLDQADKFFDLATESWVLKGELSADSNKESGYKSESSHRQELARMYLKDGRNQGAIAHYQKAIAAMRAINDQKQIKFLTGKIKEIQAKLP